MKLAPRSLSRDPSLEQQLVDDPGLLPFVEAMEWAIQHGLSPVEREKITTDPSMEELSIGLVFGREANTATRFAGYAIMVRIRWTRGREITEVRLLEVLVPEGSD